MGKFLYDLKDHLKEVSWVLILLYLLLGFVILIFSRFIGFNVILWICLGLAILITFVFASIILGNLILTGIVNLARHLLHLPKQ
jgi:hypothetical protein